MRYFTIVDFQHWIAATFLGLLLVILAYISWAGYKRRPMNKVDLSDETMPDHPPPSEDRPISPILIFVYVGCLFWMLLYMMMVGLAGGPIR
jgi:hypothetical protein